MLLILALQGGSYAAVVISLHQQGPDVHVITSGSLDMTALSFHVTASDSYAGFNASNNPPAFLSGPQVFASQFSADMYVGMIDAPTSIGTASGFRLATSGSGVRIGVTFNTYDFPEVRPVIVVPPGYLSNESVSSSSIFANTTIDALGLQRGVYTWSWGSGLSEDSITLIIPEPLTTSYIVVSVLIGLRTRKRHPFSNTHITGEQTMDVNRPSAPQPLTRSPH